MRNEDPKILAKMHEEWNIQSIQVHVQGHKKDLQEQQNSKIETIKPNRKNWKYLTTTRIIKFIIAVTKAITVTITVTITVAVTISRKSQII